MEKRQNSCCKVNHAIIEMHEFFIFAAHAKQKNSIHNIRAYFSYHKHLEMIAKLNVKKIFSRIIQRGFLWLFHFLKIALSL